MDNSDYAVVDSLRIFGLIDCAICWFTTRCVDLLRKIVIEYVVCWMTMCCVDLISSMLIAYAVLIDYTVCWLTLPCVDWLCKYALWWMTIDYELHWLSVHCFDLLCIVLKDHCCFHWLCTVCIDFAMYWLTTLLRLLLWSWWLNNKKKINSEALLSNSKPGFRFSNIVYRKSKNWKIGILVF